MDPHKQNSTFQWTAKTLKGDDDDDDDDFLNPPQSSKEFLETKVGT